jgi:hypothetical protein
MTPAPDPETVLRNLKADIRTISEWAPLAFPHQKILTPWRLAVHFKNVELAAWVKSKLKAGELVYCIFLADPPDED